MNCCAVAACRNLPQRSGTEKHGQARRGRARFFKAKEKQITEELSKGKAWMGLATEWRSEEMRKNSESRSFNGKAK